MGRTTCGGLRSVKEPRPRTYAADLEGVDICGKRLEEEKGGEAE